jgi:hypothetical protein
MAFTGTRRDPCARLAACFALPLLLVGCSADGTASRGSARPSGSSSPPAVIALVPGGDDIRPLSPGRYGLTANGSPQQPLAVVDVVPGMSSVGAFAVGVYADGTFDRYHALSYWTLAGVYADPCSKKGGLLPSGQSVADLVDALMAQNLTRTTTPQPITIDGHRGLQLDLIADATVAFDKCAGGYFDVWDSAPGGGRYLQSPGQLLRLRVLAVDGRRVVLETTAVPDADVVGLAEMDRLAQTVTFQDRPGSSPS